MPRAKRRLSGKGRKPTLPCTYELGYVRQDLYTCNRCMRAANRQLSGFCRGCRDTCHADHLEDVVELYTKRDFRCDCGNSRAKNECLLYPQKDDLNVGNERTYSHNFEGRYCRCDREYDVNLAMAQCAMCEDWFHEECYETDMKERSGSLQGEYEFTCKDCVSKLPVLAEYYEKLHAWGKRMKRSNTVGCIRPTGVDIKIKAGAIDLLWRTNFRLWLCTCKECMRIYARAKCAYIVDRMDFVTGGEEVDLLNNTEDAQILKDVLQENKAAKNDAERIPRKPADEWRVAVEDMQMVRRRIREFLLRSIETNGGNINKDSLRSYLCDLKADLLNAGG